MFTNNKLKDNNWHFISTCKKYFNIVFQDDISPCSTFIWSSDFCSIRTTVSKRQDFYVINKNGLLNYLLKSYILTKNKFLLRSKN